MVSPKGGNGEGARSAPKIPGRVSLAPLRPWFLAEGLADVPAGVVPDRRLRGRGPCFEADPFPAVDGFAPAEPV